MGARRKGRELALQMLYQWDLTSSPLEEIVESISLLRNASPEARDFAADLAKGTIERIGEVDALIAEQSEAWRLSRMAAVDRNVLRLAVYEFLQAETPKRVVINEAIEIAKKFSSPDGASFVNGVLDAVCTSIETASESPH